MICDLCGGTEEVEAIYGRRVCKACLTTKNGSQRG
jgi:hypothetical protein